MNKKSVWGINRTNLMIAGVMGSHVLITACSSMPSKTGQSPQQAVIAGYDQLYKTPNYQFDGQFKINQLVFNRDPKILQTAAELAQQKKLKKKQQLVQRYVDELTAEAKAEAYAKADSTSTADEYDLTASEQAAILKQAEQEVNELFEEENDTAKDASAKKDSTADLDEDEKESATSRLSHLNKDKLIDDLIYTYAKRYQLNYQGTIDVRHGQIALSPEIRYEARNMAGYVKVPLVLDLRHAHLYADLSALSPWLVQVKNDGKYSRFDLSAYKDKVDFKQLLQVLKQTTQASYQLPKAQYFQEMGLTASERKQGAVRKVEFTQPLAHRMADIATFLSLNQNSLKHLAKNKAATTKQAGDHRTTKNQPPVQLISADAASQLMAQHPETYENILQMIEEKIDPTSTLKQVILLDSKGRVIESDAVYNLVFNPTSNGQLNMQLSHQLNFANYGQAEVAFKPNASNWVDAKANMQDTLFGNLTSIFSKKSLGADNMLNSFGEDDSADAPDEIEALQADTAENW